jgi:serine/threonine-protein kinase
MLSRMHIRGYRIDGRLGEGGMGEVFAATNELMGKRVAIKVLRFEHSMNADVVERFFREARACALLNHPGCVDIIDTGHTEDGRGYIIMELLEGEGLKERIKRERIKPQVAISIARQIADVLSAAHAKGIVHRDLKPDNVFLVPNAAEPSGVRVKVLDFGVAKLTQGGAPKAMTNPAAIIGTPAYMAPEQFKGAGFVDAQSDIYALGCIMFEMACGREPFQGRGFGDYLMAHLSTPPPAPSSFGQVDARLERLILRALAKNKEERQKSMAEVIAELDAIAQGRTSAPRMAAAHAVTLADAGAPTVPSTSLPNAAEVRAQVEALRNARATSDPNAATRPAGGYDPNATTRSGQHARARGKRSPALLIFGLIVVLGAAAGAAAFFLTR